MTHEGPKPRRVVVVEETWFRAYNRPRWKRKTVEGELWRDYLTIGGTNISAGDFERGTVVTIRGSLTVEVNK